MSQYITFCAFNGASAAFFLMENQRTTKNCFCNKNFDFYYACTKRCEAKCIRITWSCRWKILFWFYYFSSVIGRATFGCLPRVIIHFIWIAEKKEPEKLPHVTTLWNESWLRWTSSRVSYIYQFTFITFLVRALSNSFAIDKHRQNTRNLMLCYLRVFSMFAAGCKFS